MPIVGAPSNAAPSHLGVVLRAISDYIAESGNGTPVMVGAYYASTKTKEATRGAGSPPHVILVPEPDSGRCKIDFAYELGRPAKQVHSCDVIVRAAEGGGDIDYWNAAYDLSDIVIDAVKLSCQGRVVFGEPTGDYPTPFAVDSPAGAQLSWGFTFDRDVRGSDALRRVRLAPAEDPPAIPLSPPGETGILDTLDGDVTPKDDDQ